MGLLRLIQRGLLRPPGQSVAEAKSSGTVAQQRVDALTEQQVSKKIDQMRDWFRLLHEAQSAANTLRVHLEPVGSTPSPYGTAVERAQLERWCEKVSRACQRIPSSALNRLDDLLYYSPSHREATGRAPVADDELRTIAAQWSIARQELEEALADAQQNTRLARILWERASEDGSRLFNIDGPAIALTNALSSIVHTNPLARLEGR